MIMGMLLMVSVNVAMDVAVKALTAYVVVYAGRRAWQAASRKK